MQVWKGTWGEQEAVIKTLDVSGEDKTTNECEQDPCVVRMVKELSALNHLAVHKVIFELFLLV